MYKFLYFQKIPPSITIYKTEFYNPITYYVVLGLVSKISHWKWLDYNSDDQPSAIHQNCTLMWVYVYLCRLLF